ncbi:MAG TPA: hypothetical protein VGD65_20295 [Chryseosolibacter sp.]
MASTTAIILIASMTWITLCYFLLFRKKSPKGINTSLRTDEDVIAFHPLTKNIHEPAPSPAAPPDEMPEDILLTPTLAPNVIDEEDNINDEDLIDLRTLSLNLTNQN